MAEDLIAEVKPKAYEKAAIYLWKVQRVLKKTEKNKEWQKYILEIKHEHVRKRRLLEILDGLDDKRILDTL